jgi:PspA-Associated protein
MIVRILSEGQWRIESGAQAGLNALDDAVEQAVSAGDQAQLGEALRRLHDQVRAVGVVVPDEEIADSDLILPDVDASLDEVRALLSESDEGLIPN